MKLGILGTLMMLVLGATTSVSANEPVEEVSYIQNLGGRNGIDLNGAWARIIDPYENGYYNHRYLPHENGYFKNRKMQSPADLVEYNFDTAPTINVPGDWNSQEAELFFYEGTVWYQRYFDIQKKANKKVVIQFGAINYKAIVYINGMLVGDHEGGFTSFQFDITDHVIDGENFIVVKVDNRRERNQIPTVNTDWWNYGGITRAVSIFELPRSHIQDYRVHLAGSQADQVEIEVAVAGGKRSAQSVIVAIPELGVRKELKLNADGRASLTLAASPVLWSPDTPKLYQVELFYGDDAVSDLIGFRRIEVVGDEILLNGQPVFLRGISIHEESPLAAGRAWSEADARTTLSWAKELGANFVRLAHYPHNEAMLRMADEMGLMVWSEIPVYWTVLFGDESVYKKAEKQLSEMIVRDKNRASIIMWSVANETPLSTDRLRFLGNLIDKTRQLDPSRLITAAIDTHDVSDNEIVLKDPLAEQLDVIGINSYCGWYWAKPHDCANKTWRSDYGKPIIMSEMGGGAKQGLFGAEDEIWTEEFQASIYLNNLKMASNIKSLRGLSPWVLKDFRSPRRPLNGVQDFWNRKGLVSERGIKKKAWYVLRDFYADIRANED